jgi:polar amino acid transport system permease protein
MWVFFRDAWNCALFAFTLNTAAYQAEILRGAIESVPRGQWEGAASARPPNVQTFWKIILPQALIVALRPYGNEIILMIKGSAIVAIVTVFDLMGETRRAYSRTYDFQAYIWAAVLYLMVVETLRRIWDKLEACHRSSRQRPSRAMRITASSAIRISMPATTMISCARSKA